jgi:O-antigen ligase
VGLFGTTSINGRVRWLGIIEDPNELAMCLSLCAPLLIGLFLLRPGWRNGVLLVSGLAAFLLCVVFTESRGGQLVFLAALGAYFVRRFGVRGIVVMGLFAVPVLLLGGRSGAEADQSKMERIEALYTAMSLVRQSPIVGVGFTRFTDYNVLTAHNSYALAAAETGLPGLFLFLAVLYQSMKSFVVVALRTQNEGPTRPAYVWAGALLAAQAGLMVGIFFLSFNASPILWTFLGLFGGFQLAARRHDPSFDFSLKARDFLAIGALTVVIPQLLYVYSHLKIGAGE